MKILELDFNNIDEKLIEYIENIEWGAGKLISKLLKENSFKERKGEDSRFFYAIENDQFVGFFSLVNQDYMPLKQYDRFIASVWVDPKFRKKGYSRKFVSYAEKESGKNQIHILSQHKGLYEKMGYKLIDTFTGSIHDKEYLYEKNL